MSAFWRVAGLNYVQYSTIAARAVRQVLMVRPRMPLPRETSPASSSRSGRVASPRARSNKCQGCRCQERHHQHQVPEVGGWQAPGHEAINAKDAAAKRDITSIKFQKW